jgi:kinesin family protein 18/19
MDKKITDNQQSVSQIESHSRQITDHSHATLPLINNIVANNNNPYHAVNNYFSNNNGSSSMNAAQQQAADEAESNILVAVRVRPLLFKETSINDMDIARVEDKLMIILDPFELECEIENKKMMDVLHRSKEQRYAFDKIFRDHSQEEIYNETCKGLIRPVLNGYNSCVFAYGPTGTGKTYTMLGNNEIPGIMVLTVKDIFESIKKLDDKEFQIVVSYVEIYNETIRDLLVPSSTYLELRDDPIKGITIAGVTEFKAESLDQIMNLLFMGNKRRTTEATNANQTSSRSHAVFQILVNSTPRTKNTSVESLQGKLSLIDLAGSERGTVTENRGIRLREGAKINRSLLALANCINALGDKTKKGFFVPYRDSKLTRLLKDSLGGNCKTVMIANISPASSQIEETINTLKYANRAKNIKTKAMSNKKMVQLHIAEYKNIISDLRLEIDQLKSKLVDGPRENDYVPLLTVPQHGQNTYNVSPNPQNSQNITKMPTGGGSGAGAKGNRNPNDCPCFCGRLEDDIEMKKIQAEIFENFQERIQLRRALMELEEQNALNVLEIRKKQAEIMVWQKKDTDGVETSPPPQELISVPVPVVNKSENSTHRLPLESHLKVPLNAEEEGKRPLSACPKDIQTKYKSIQTLRVSTDKNAIKREMMNIQLAENISVAKKIRDSITKRIHHKDKREYLEMVIKNHVLELQNIELEIHLQIQEKTINDLKNIIQSQKKVIQDHKLDNIKMPWEENAELLSDEMSQNDGDSEDINIDDLVYDDNVDDNEGVEDDDEQLDDIEFKEYMEKRGNGPIVGGAGGEPAKNGQQAKPPNNNNTNTSVNKGKKKGNNNNVNNKEHNNANDGGGKAALPHPRVNLRPPEENKENKVLENNYVSEEKKAEKSRDVLTSVEINDADIGLDQQNQGAGDDNSPRNTAGGNQNKNKVGTNKNDISVISSSLSKEKTTGDAGGLPKVVKKNPSLTSNPVIPAPSGINFLPQIGNVAGNNSANHLNNKELPSVIPKNPASNAPKLPPPNNQNAPPKEKQMLKSNIAAVAIYSSSNKKKKS